MSMTDEVPQLRRGGEASAVGVRASHADRDRVVELLEVAAVDGRLTPGELDERLEAALTARTRGELAVLTTDLTVASGSAPGSLVRRPEDLVRIECRSSSSSKRDGRWLVPDRMEVRVTNGTVTLDFTQAVISQPSLVIDADVSSGRLTLVTKPGIAVNTDVAADSSYVKVRAPRDPEVPVILRIQVSGKVCGGHITARPPRRTFRRWLRRHP